MENGVVRIFCDQSLVATLSGKGKVSHTKEKRKADKKKE